MLNVFSHFAPAMLGVFMLALALAPLVLVWSDSRRAARNSRLRRLQDDASLATLLASRQQAARGRLTALETQAD